MVTDDSRVRKEENVKGSITEKEMNSHAIIREILQRCKSMIDSAGEKTVKHDINRVSPSL